jgi:hypothetical protein
MCKETQALSGGAHLTLEGFDPPTEAATLLDQSGTVASQSDAKADYCAKSLLEEARTMWVNGN